MIRRVAWAGLVFCATAVMGAPDLALLQRQVFVAERAFARSMAERDFAAFTARLSEHAIFINGPQPTRGKATVAAGWKAFFDGPQAPFSWDPDQVEVTGDGELAHSTGLVREPGGKPVGRFNSVWRQEAPGIWRVVFDKGSPLTEAERKQP